MSMDKEYIDSVTSGKRGTGQAALLKYLHGSRLTQQKAIHAKCYECNGMGESDTCDMVECPLHPYSPYGKTPVVDEVKHE